MRRVISVIVHSHCTRLHGASLLFPLVCCTAHVLVLHCTMFMLRCTMRSSSVRVRFCCVAPCLLCVAPILMLHCNNSLPHCVIRYVRGRMQGACRPRACKPRAKIALELAQGAMQGPCQGVRGYPREIYFIFQKNFSKYLKKLYYHSGIKIIKYYLYTYYRNLGVRLPASELTNRAVICRRGTNRAVACSA